MKQIIVVLLVVVTGFAFSAGRPAEAATGGGQELPAGAELLQAIVIPGRPHTEAVVFHAGGYHLGVLVRANGMDRLLWSHTLGAAPTSLLSPGPAGLFIVLHKDTGGSGATLYAFRLSQKRVQSAVDGHAAGRLKADEGISMQGLRFTASQRDQSHVGSVHYRIVTDYGWGATTFMVQKRVTVPDYAVGAYPVPSATVDEPNGNIVLLRLEIASTEAQRETGLMNRQALDPDSGMLFVWGGQTHESFWMENTLIPLTVAFLGRDGTIQEIQDMQAMTTTLHTPADPYFYALEVNLGAFAARDITVGERIQLSL